MAKRLTLLQLMLTLALSPVAFSFLAAQSDYKPMLELTRFRWINGWYDNNMGKELNYLYDTLVENRQLKVYHFQHEGWDFLTGVEYLREDIQERKVWHCFPGNDTIPYSEYLLYDFSLQTGDTVSLDYQAPDTFRLVYVHHIDTIQLLDGPHRRLVMYRWWEGSGYPPHSGNQPYYDIIEGVGNLYMPLYSDVQSWYFTALCAWRGDQPVVGACEQSQIQCDAITIDAIENFGDYLQLHLSYGQADWPIYSYKILVLDMAGDTIGRTLYSPGHIMPNESMQDWVEGEENIGDLPNPVRVIVIDQLTQQQCEILYSTTGLKGPVAPEQLRVYPNPNSGDFQVELPANFDVARVLLFDAQGRRYDVFSTAADSSFRISAGHLPDGVYSILLSASDGELRLARVMISGR